MGLREGEPRPRTGIEGEWLRSGQVPRENGGKERRHLRTVACPCWLTPSGLFPAPSYQGHSHHQNLGGSHSPTSTPLPWHPLRGTVTCASIDSPSPVPQPDGLGSGPCSADCVTLGKWRPISGPGMASGIQAQDRQLGLGRTGRGWAAPSSLCLSRSAGGGSTEGPSAVPATVVSVTHASGHIGVGHWAPRLSPLTRRPGQGRRLFSEPRS